VFGWNSHEVVRSRERGVAVHTSSGSVRSSQPHYRASIIFRINRLVMCRSGWGAFDHLRQSRKGIARAKEHVISISFTSGSNPTKISHCLSACFVPRPTLCHHQTGVKPVSDPPVNRSGLQPVRPRQKAAHNSKAGDEKPKHQPALAIRLRKVNAPAGQNVYSTEHRRTRSKLALRRNQISRPRCTP
jgi:hypothetical protein